LDWAWCGGLLVSGTCSLNRYELCSVLETERGDVEAEVRMLDASDGVPRVWYGPESIAGRGEP
jgi:hypothetical protein